MSARDDVLLYRSAPTVILWAIEAYGALPGRYLSDIPPEPLQLSGRELWMLPEGVEDLPTDFYFVPHDPITVQWASRRPAGELCTVAVPRSFAAKRDWRVIPVQPLTLEERPVAYAWNEGLARVSFDLLDRPLDANDDQLLAARMARALSPEAVPFDAIVAIYVASEEVRARAIEGLRPSSGDKLIVDPERAP